MAPALRSRPAHAPGPTYMSYTPNGKKLVTVGINGALRIFQHGSDGEPDVIDVRTENHTAVVATNDFFIVGCEDGTVTKYSLLTNQFEQILIRCTLSVRDLSLSKDGEWVAVASDELEVKVVNTRDMTRVTRLRELPRAVKHVSFDNTGTILAVSCSDGTVLIYSLSTEQESPPVLKQFPGLTRSLETDAEASTRVYWHPDGRAFAVPTASRDFQVVARTDWQLQKTFAGGHRADISAAAWSPNGALLATAGIDKSLVLWDTRMQKILKRFDDIHYTILAAQWHPATNLLSYTNINGELFIREGFVPGEFAKSLEKDLEAAPMNHVPSSQNLGDSQGPAANGGRPRNDVDDDYLDVLLGADGVSEDGVGFIEDDDGAGYAEGPVMSRKRAAEAQGGRAVKRHAQYSAWQPKLHIAIQAGSTPWKGDRRYLCLNLTGFVWTVNQNTHNTITVEFYDRQEHRDFHFTDLYKYDKACLNEKGALFSSPISSQRPAVLHYRPHETWTSRTDWRIPLPAGEEVTSMSLSESCIVATTSGDYVRIYSLFGVPLKVYRQKSTPAVACASWRDYVMTVGNGPVIGEGTTRLQYTIENVKRDEICQSEDTLALPPGNDLRSLFFSDTGDPCVYDNTGVLLILLHWRTPGQAQWVPLLDTKSLDRLAVGKKHETYWPVAVAGGKFHCIILKGGEEYPYFPRPLLSDFDFQIPISTVPRGDEDEDDEAVRKRELEEQYARASLLHALHKDVVDNTNATSSQKAQLAELERDVDKGLLQLLATECREGEERGMKALEMVSLLRQRTDKILEVAGKIASRYGRDILGEKIMQLAERRLVGLDDDDDGYSSTVC